MGASKRPQETLYTVTDDSSDNPTITEYIQRRPDYCKVTECKRLLQIKLEKLMAQKNYNIFIAI